MLQFNPILIFPVSTRKELTIMADEMLSAGKWAAKLGVPAKKFKDAIKAAGIEPDSKKGACAYYSSKTAEKIKRKIK